MTKSLQLLGTPNIKFADNDTVIKLLAYEDSELPDYVGANKISFVLSNTNGVIREILAIPEIKKENEVAQKTADIEETNELSGIITLNSADLKGLPVNNYKVELWVMDSDNNLKIFPDSESVYLKINPNGNFFEGEVVSTVTLSDFEQRFKELQDGLVVAAQGPVGPKGDQGLQGEPGIPGDDGKVLINKVIEKFLEKGMLTQADVKEINESLN